MLDANAVWLRIICGRRLAALGLQCRHLGAPDGMPDLRRSPAPSPLVGVVLCRAAQQRRRRDRPWPRKLRSYCRLSWAATVSAAAAGPSAKALLGAIIVLSGHQRPGPPRPPKGARLRWCSASFCCSRSRSTCVGSRTGKRFSPKSMFRRLTRPCRPPATRAGSSSPYADNDNCARYRRRTRPSTARGRHSGQRRQHLHRRPNWRHRPLLRSRL